MYLPFTSCIHAEREHYAVNICICMQVFVNRYVPCTSVFVFVCMRSLSTQGRGPESQYCDLCSLDTMAMGGGEGEVND